MVASNSGRTATRRTGLTGGTDGSCGRPGDSMEDLLDRSRPMSPANARKRTEAAGARGQRCGKRIERHRGAEEIEKLASRWTAWS